MESGGAIAAEFRVEATRPGRFMTERQIGDAVRAGQIVGGLGNQAIAAPANGVLLGLAARGARIEPGDPLLEVDPAGVPHRCFGIRPAPQRVAERVLAVLARVGYARRGPLSAPEVEGIHPIAH